MFSNNQFGDQPVHEKWMRVALREARQAIDEDEVPVGAVVVAAGALATSTKPMAVCLMGVVFVVVAAAVR